MTEHQQHDHDGITEDREQRPPVYFTVLFYGLIVWGVAFSAFYLLSGWSSDAEFQAKMKSHQEQFQAPATSETAKAEPAPAPQQPEPSQAVATAAPTDGTPDAKALYDAKCAMCHGGDAKGGFGPDLTAAEYEYGKSREGIFLSIAEGRGNGKMPGFEGQLKREEMYALTDYLLAL